MKGVTRILFVCHGNICRSPMAEMVFKNMVRKRGIEDCFDVASAATSAEELGNPVHRGTQRVLAAHDVPCERRAARRLTAQDAEAWDYLIGMDGRNMKNMARMLPDCRDKQLLLLDFAGRPGQDVADPWYTGDFDVTYRDVVAGCEGLLEHLGFKKM